MNLKEKYDQFKADEKKLRKINAEKKAWWASLTTHILVALHFPAVIVGHIFLIIFLCSLGELATALAIMILAVLGSFGVIAYVAFVSESYFSYSYFGYSGSGLNKVNNFWVRFFDKREECKALQNGQKERQAFFKFYEMMQDPLFAEAFIKSMSPDAELVERFRKEGLIK